MPNKNKSTELTARTYTSLEVLGILHKFPLREFKKLDSDDNNTLSVRNDIEDGFIICYNQRIDFRLDEDFLNAIWIEIPNHVSFKEAYIAYQHKNNVKSCTGVIYCKGSLTFPNTFPKLDDVTEKELRGRWTVLYLESE